MSKRQPIKALVDSAFVVARTRRQNVVESLSYIPGATLKGALAQHFIDEAGLNGNRAEFIRLFVRGGLKVGNLYPSPVEDKDISPTIPIPKTAFSCKRYPGFLKSSAEEHGVIDILIADTAERLKGAWPSGQGIVCETCNHPVEAFAHGFCAKDKKTKKWLEIKVAADMRMHTAIDPKSQTALSGSLYSYQANGAPDQPFVGSIGLGSDEDSFAKLRAKEGRFVLGLGKGVTRGYGAMRIVKAYADSLPWESTAVRLCKLNDSLSASLDGASLPTVFALTLLSDVIMRKPSGQYGSLIEPADLASLRSICELDILWAATEIISVSGWNSHWGLPKTDERAIKMGSVFVYKFHKRLDKNELDQLAQAMEKIEESGIGRRQEDGFGAVSFCHPFHIDQASGGKS